MASKKVTYVEPSDYFTPNMRKIAEEADKKAAAKRKEAERQNKPKK